MSDLSPTLSILVRQRIVDDREPGEPSQHLGRNEALLASVATERNRQSFAELFAYYAPRLKSHLLARGAEGSVAEEIIQEVMLTIWRKADQFCTTRGSASAWVFALARNAFIDRVRRERRPEVDPGDALFEAVSPALDSLAMEAEAQRALTAAVESLPAEQQVVVQRSYFQGQSLAEIAVAEQLPLGTVKTRARLALERLRAVVNQRNIR